VAAKEPIPAMQIPKRHKKRKKEKNQNYNNACGDLGFFFSSFPIL